MFSPSSARIDLEGLLYHLILMDVLTIFNLFQIVVGTKRELNVNLETVTEKAATYAMKNTDQMTVHEVCYVCRF